MSNPNNPIHVSSRETSPEHNDSDTFPCYDASIGVDRNGDPICGKDEPINEETNRKDLWRDTAAIHNVSSTGFPLPENGDGNGWVRSVSMHNAIAEYSAMMYQEDAIDQASTRFSTGKESTTRSKNHAKAKQSASKSTSKTATPKAPAKQQSSVSHRAGSVTSSAPAVPAAPAAPQRVTRSSARLSSTSASQVGPSAAISAAPVNVVASISTATSKTPAPPVGTFSSTAPGIKSPRRSGRLMKTAGQNQSGSGTPLSVSNNKINITSSEQEAKSSFSSAVNSNKIKIISSDSNNTVAQPSIPNHRKIKIVIRSSNSTVAQTSIGAILHQAQDPSKEAESDTAKNKTVKTTQKAAEQEHGVASDGAANATTNAAITPGEKNAVDKRKREESEESEGESGRQAKLPRHEESQHPILSANGVGRIRLIRRRSV
ncbi:hypothetical protein V8F06_009407 [Rhypophila decipiens]